MVDCHAAILMAIFFTAWLFGIFSFFKEWTRDCVTQQRIIQTWNLHFPHFPYNEYNKEIDDIYTLAIEENIKDSDMEMFILDKLSL